MPVPPPAQPAQAVLRALPAHLVTPSRAAFLRGPASPAPHLAPPASEVKPIVPAVWGGYTKQSWKCQNNNYVGFQITLNANAATVFGAIDQIVAAFLTATGESSGNLDAVTFTTFTSGSTIVGGSFTSTTGVSHLRFK
ncbi:unnamed protein product [Sphagnum balticum]